MPDFVVNAGLWVLSSVVFALVLSVVGNLITEPVKNQLGRISITMRKNIARSLKSELDMISNLKSSNQALNLYIFQLIFVIIRRLMFAALLFPLCLFQFAIILPKYDMTDKIAAVDVPYVVLSMVLWFICSMIVFSVIESCRIVIKNIKSVMNFDEFTSYTSHRIAELEQKYIANKEKLTQ